MRSRLQELQGVLERCPEHEFRCCKYENRRTSYVCRRLQEQEQELRGRVEKAEIEAERQGLEVERGKIDFQRMALEVSHRSSFNPHLVSTACSVDGCYDGSYFCSCSYFLFSTYQMVALRGEREDLVAKKHGMEQELEQLKGVSSIIMITANLILS